MTAIGLVQGILSELYEQVREFIAIPETDLKANKKKAVAIIALIDKDLKKMDKVQKEAIMPLLTILESQPEYSQNRNLINLSSFIRQEVSEAAGELKKLLNGYRFRMETALKLVAEGGLGLKDEKTVIRARAPLTPRQEEMDMNSVIKHLEKAEELTVQIKEAASEYANA